MDGRQRIARCCDYEKIIIIFDFLPRRRFRTSGGVLVKNETASKLHKKHVMYIVIWIRSKKI